MMISCIILTYNQLENTTLPMCKTLISSLPAEGWEVIFVDNHSSDGTPEFIRNLQMQYSNVRAIFNGENLGFSKGMNQGLSVAKGEVLFLMNNDILFHSNWLAPILAVIHRPETGLVSPVVNQPGDGTTVHNYVQKADAILGSQNQDAAYRCFVPFCCVGFRREVFEKIGYLDEVFTLAYFEDNDYCLRSLYSGYKNAIALKSFVFHNHCQTTGKMEDRKALLDRNRKYFYQKHLLGEHIDQLERTIKLLRKKLLSYRIKKIFIEFICFFIYPPKKKKKCRNRLNHLLHLTSCDGWDYASENTDYL